jgi:NhaP-type Na+/H+ or K+/H+ antiporter
VSLGHLHLLVPAAAVGGDDFARAVLTLGALLVFGALLSGLAGRSLLSLTALFVLAGFVLGDGALDVLHFDPRSGFVGELAIVALVIILFRDGLEVEAEMLQTAWHLPLRKLVLAMPVTCGLVALLTKAVTDLSWTESFLVGALLSPTDPVLSSSVVTNPRVPRLIRHSLNLESGMNDGLALPAVLALSAALRVGGGHFDVVRFVLQDVLLGLVTGLVVAFVAARLVPRGQRLDETMPAHHKSLYALGVAFATYGIAVLPPRANGLIAVYVCAIAFGTLRPDMRHYFESRADEIVEIVKLGVFVVFGSLLTFDALFNDGWAAVAIVAFLLLVARPVAVIAALAGTRQPWSTKLFMAWFGPKGVATMTFSLLVLADTIPNRDRIFDIAALAVFVSIIAHGVTDNAGVEWIARRSARGSGGSSGERKPSQGRTQGRCNSSAIALTEDDA